MIDHPLGLVHGLDIEKYHAGPGLSNSGLTLLAKSPEHFFGLKLHPSRPPEKSKAGQLEGNLMHCALFEPKAFIDRYRIGPSVNRATKEWKAFCAEHEDAVCIQDDQFATAFAQAASLLNTLAFDPVTNGLMKTGQAEVSGYWVDKKTGVLCRFRADWVHEVFENGKLIGVILFDGKTYSDASSHEFSRQIGRKGYHRQAAFYSMGYYACTGVPVLAFVFGCVETEWPYVSQTYVLDEVGMNQGREEVDALLEVYAECQKSGVWPGYASGLQTIALPSWMTEGGEVEVSYA